MHISRILGALLCALGTLCAVDTKTWQQGEMADFEKGTLTHLSLGSDGRLALAPVVKEIFDPSVAFLWAIARDSKGNLYAGGGGLGGSKTKLFMVEPGGKAKTLAELDGITIQAIAIDSKDRVYAATSPDGKVYRVETSGATSGKSEVFYDPKQKYIWALEFSRSGDLFVATGDQGEIHRVTPAGAGSVFFKTEETHARSMAIDPNGNLIVGTDPSGLILRITPAGEGFVLYQAPKREITVVAVSSDGTIYAAGVGNKQAAVAAPAPTPAPAPAPPAPGARAGAPAPPTLAGAAPAITGGSEIYRIQTDGYPRKIWSHPQDLVYALAFDGRGRVMAGTGNHGDIYRLEPEHKYWKLLSLSSTQVTGFCSAGGRLYAVTGNIGKIFSIGPELEQTGVFESDIFDAGAFSYWGRLSYSPKENNGVVVETRSGNLNRAQKNWNEFARTNAGRIVSPPARFLEYRLTLSGGGEITEVDAAYQMKNVAPELEEIEITPENYKFPAPSASAPAAGTSLTLAPLGHHNASASSTNPPASDSGSSPAMTYAKGWIGVRWLANDDNGDSMLFKVEIRGANESAWKLLRDKIREHYYSWDSTAFPDGRYFVRITATDAPSNPPEQALTASEESEPFLIDNAPPEITGLNATLSGAKIDVRFHAKDGLSTLSKAEYSINGAEWMVVEPTTRLTDSMEHDYHLQVDRGAGENTVAVRVADENDNQSVAKIVVK
jgi:sugar lactone lactonase YvrE